VTKGDSKGRRKAARGVIRVGRREGVAGEGRGGETGDQRGHRDREKEG